jgi:hypothetical protein
MPNELCTGSQIFLHQTYMLLSVVDIISKLEISAESICMHCEIRSIYSEEDSVLCYCVH